MVSAHLGCPAAQTCHLRVFRLGTPATRPNHQHHSTPCGPLCATFPVPTHMTGPTTWTVALACSSRAGVTNDMLVLIEPGTPAGFSNILEARSGILDYEGRRAAKLQKRLSTATDNTEASTTSSSSSSSRTDAALEAKVNSKWFGAHVVAPCPHDAPCPLAVPGSRSWCHFGTRFLRPGFMQQSKALAGQRMNPADHQDERYSYVVLR